MPDPYVRQGALYGQSYHQLKVAAPAPGNW